jgi:hypothetical protein
VRVEKQRNTALIQAGAMVWGLSYAAATAVGILFLNLDDSNTTSTWRSGSTRTGGGLLLIPLVGPFVTGFAYRDASWAVPWAFVGGMAQLAGLVMIVKGARDTRDVLVPDLGAVRVSIAPFATPTAGGLTMSGSF